VSFGETVPYVGGSAAFPVGVGDASFEPCMSACSVLIMSSRLSRLLLGFSV
jgi:hypothetical protein